MRKFWFYIWSRWVLFLTLESVAVAAVLALVVTFVTYYLKGAVKLDTEVTKALFELFRFWFALLWSVTLLISNFRSLKILFNRCHNGYVFKLFTCKGDEIIENIGYGDLVKVFRKWLMAMIWFVAALLVVTFFINSFVFHKEGWYTIYLLYVYILLSGGLNIALIGYRCKRVKVMRC